MDWGVALIYAGAIAFLVFLWGVYRYCTNSWNVLGLAMGADGLYSTSKMQWLLWTIVVLFVYMLVLFAVLDSGDLSAGAKAIGIPANLFVAMGLSLGTVVAAKAITQGQVNRGLIHKEPADPQKDGTSEIGSGGQRQDAAGHPNGMAALFMNDNNEPDLPKTQLMMWTLVALAVFVVSSVALVTRILEGEIPEELFLPEIDAVLLALMGLGQGAYLGTKLVSTTTARLTGVQGKPNGEVVLYGMAFGNQPLGSQIILVIDGKRQQLAPHTVAPDGPEEWWADDKIRFTLPARQPDGQPWRSGTIEIGLEVGGQKSANFVSYTVNVPVLYNVLPQDAKPGDVVTLIGARFGEPKEGNRVVLGGRLQVEVPEDKWGDTRIEFEVPQPTLANGWRPQPSGDVVLGIYRDDEFVLWDAKEHPRLKVESLPILFPLENPSKVMSGGLVVLQGYGFGKLQPTSRLIINGQEFGKDTLSDLSWGNDEIRFTLPKEMWVGIAGKTSITIQVRTDGKQSGDQTFTLGGDA